MEGWKNVLREKHEELATQLQFGDFNGLLDEMWSKKQFNDHERDKFQTAATDSEIQKKEKISGFVKHLGEKMSEDTLKVFYEALLKFEYTEAKKLIERYLPQLVQNENTASESTAEAQDKQTDESLHQDTSPDNPDSDGDVSHAYNSQVHREPATLVCEFFPDNQMFVCLALRYH